MLSWCTQCTICTCELLLLAGIQRLLKSRPVLRIPPRLVTRENIPPGLLLQEDMMIRLGQRALHTALIDRAREDADALGLVVVKHVHGTAARGAVRALRDVRIPHLLERAGPRRPRDRRGREVGEGQERSAAQLAAREAVAVSHFRRQRGRRVGDGAAHAAAREDHLGAGRLHTAP